MVFARLFGFLHRLIRGQDVLLIQHTKEQWERQFSSGTWNRLQERQPNTAELARLVIDFAHAKGAPTRILDIGCGNGGLARFLSPEPGIAYMGIDISETALVAARAVAPNYTFVVADAESPPQGLGTFDVLVFNEVLYYMNPDLVLPRYRTYVTPDTRIFISIVRSWRTPFLLRRIRHFMRVERRFRLGSRCLHWDIATGYFL